MTMQSLRLRAFALVAGVAVLAFSGWASADPPSRVARMGYMSGAVSFSFAGENDWVEAAINRPLTTGDRLWADARGRAEIQVGGAMIRMHANTGVSILNLDDRIAQLQLTQGTLNVRVRRLRPNQVFEVDTPNLAFILRQPGEFRIEVDPDADATTIIVRKGEGDAYGEDGAYLIDSGQAYRFTGTRLREYEYVDPPRLDEFDRWASDRDRAFDNSTSARYVSQDVVGYQDLDANGTWRVDATYGNVWFPSRVAAGWAPYRDGHWAWVDPWGWTWVDDAPWGFAVSHYGRWANLRGTWGWVPGPVQTRAYYAPALVVFVGGDNFQLTISSGNVGGVAWFPLGPREVYRPSYPVSRGYFQNINRSNTVITNTVINNYYNNPNVPNVVYANRQVAGAVVAVPRTAFVQSQPVARAAVRVSREMIVERPVAVAPPVAPTERSVRGAAAQRDRPPARVFERPVVARTAPPAARAGFAAQQQQLTAQPGKPLDDAARRQLKPAAAAPAPVVKVVEQPQKAPPTRRPPPAAPEQRGKSEQRGKGEPRGQPAAPPPQRAAEPTAVAPQAAPPAPATPPQRSAPPKVAPPPQVAPPAPAAQPPEQRGKSEQRGKGEPRGQPAAPPPQRAAEPTAVAPQAAPPAPATPPQRSVPVPAAAPQAAPPAPAAQPPEQRGKSEQRGKAEQRGQPAAPLPQRAAEPTAVAPQVAPPAPATPPQRSAPPKAVPKPPEARKAPPPVSVPVPPEIQKGRQPKPDASKSAERREEKMGGEQPAREEKPTREEEGRKRRP